MHLENSIFEKTIKTGDSTVNQNFLNVYGMDLEQLLLYKESWNSPFLFAIDWANPLSPDGNYAVGIGIRVFLCAFIFQRKYIFVQKQKEDGNLSDNQLMELMYSCKLIQGNYF